MEASTASSGRHGAGKARRPRAPTLVSDRVLRAAGDERLVALVRGGSQAAFRVVYDRHHRGILSFARHMLGSQHDAEDVVQHTFMAAYGALLDSDREVRLRPWLYAIARNRCISILRGRHERPVEEIDAVATDGLAEQVRQREELRDMLRDVAALPEEQRAALVLSELGALSHEDVAEVVGCRTEKVKALVFQARSSLHQSREARETPCEEIREQISELRGGSLRRTKLRRHVRECAGCREFEAEVKRQRRAMAVLLPVVPTAGLRESTLGAAFGATGASGAAAGVGAVAGGGAVAGTLASGGTTALVAKALVVAAVAGGGAVGVERVADSGDRPRGSEPGMPAATESPGGGMPAAGAATGSGADATGRGGGGRADEHATPRRRGHDDRGREFAKTRGKGRKRGLNGTQPGKADKAPKEPSASQGTGARGPRPDRIKKDRPERKPPPPRGSDRPERPPKPERAPEPILPEPLPPGRS